MGYLQANFCSASSMLLFEETALSMRVGRPAECVIRFRQPTL
jgi:hypothetical protein